MSRTGLDVFDKTLQTTHIWLDELMEATGLDRNMAWHVLGAVLRSLRDRLPLELAAHFGAQLPLVVRGTYYDQFRPGHTHERISTENEFLISVASDLDSIRPVDVKQVTRSVLAVVGRHVTPEQVEKVKHALPERIRAVWPAPGETA